MAKTENPRFTAAKAAACEYTAAAQNLYQELSRPDARPLDNEHPAYVRFAASKAAYQKFC